jgi:hypothetical protein
MRGLFVLVVLAFGCGPDRERPLVTEPAAAPAAAARPEPEAAPAPPAPGSTRDIAGLRVTPNLDGTIRLEGTDVWGGDVSATYQSIGFLEPALEIYDRSLTPEQAAGLRALAAELRAASPAAAAAPAPPPPAAPTP